ncbi:MAG: ring-1,2-phenylacetyl-CoA epoxidase subunit PaaE [Gammaproteobacteria bacterium]|jgi:ring-1,2-phenylacetyl-CoA epoxidase subunit PaaE
MHMAQFETLTVKDVIRETVDTVSVGFDVPESLAQSFRFKQGQYLTLRKELKGEDTRRSYSICSGVTESELRVAIKQVDGGMFSTFANKDLKAGQELQVMPPMGNFTSELHPDNEKHYVLFAAGSGVTPMMSIVKSVLAIEPKSEVSLIYGNRYFKSIIFRDELEDLKDMNLGRLRIFHVLSGEMNEIDMFAGRINGEKTEKLFSTFLSPERCDEVFICGPETMINEVSSACEKVGIAKDNIHFELFTSPKGSLEKAKNIEVADEHKGKTCHVDIILYGQQWEFDMPFDKPILDAAIDKGLDLPFSCKGGMCCTCRAKLEKGSVNMLVNYALEPGEVDAGFVLTCQSIPTSDSVKVNFDQQ